jgi:hypothetical protein
VLAATIAAMLAHSVGPSFWPGPILYRRDRPGSEDDRRDGARTLLTPAPADNSASSRARRSYGTA